MPVVHIAYGHACREQVKADIGISVIKVERKVTRKVQIKAKLILVRLRSEQQCPRMCMECGPHRARCRNDVRGWYNQTLQRMLLRYNYELAD